MSDRPIKVLLVEDNPGDARLIREALAEAGTARFKLAHIEHLREGLQRLAEGGIDVVLLDLSLPDGQGLDTFTRMHAAKPDIPIVVLTGLDDETLAVKAVRGGAQDYLVKGEVNGKMLSRVLRYAIERKRMHELEAANAALNEGNRAKSRFLATISHELLTPLTAIIGFSELLQDQDFGPLKEKQAEYFNIILTKSRHLLALINDVLDFTKVEAGKLELHPDAFHLPEVVAAALAGIRHQAEAKGLQLELHVANGLSTLVADPVRFKQILYNLLSNAVKFTPAGGTITLSARVQRPTSEVQSLGGSDVGPWTLDARTFVEIAVQDTGIGIKPEDMPKLFQPFTQLDASLARRHQGTGLGLALTKKLVELHGGTIRVESPGEGQGSTFTVTLPLRGPTAAQAPPA